MLASPRVGAVKARVGTFDDKIGPVTIYLIVIGMAYPGGTSPAVK